jgi:hypothetical protein
LSHPQIVSELAAELKQIIITASARVINEELEYIDLWMKVNKLSVNTDKTNYILFKGKNKKIQRIYLLYLIKPS